MSNAICPKCGLLIGSSESDCENCYRYNDYHGPDYHADRDGEQWVELFDRLRDNQDG